MVCVRTQGYEIALKMNFFCCLQLKIETRKAKIKMSLIEFILDFTPRHEQGPRRGGV